MKKIIFFIWFFLLAFFASMALWSQQWDSTKQYSWTQEFQEISIPSSVDNSDQKALFYHAKSLNPRPLIVSLHTWSGDYKQEDPIINDIILNDYNYIHPDFRGPNNRPDAGGSDKVINDIHDAIDFAIKNANVDVSEIHIIGVSGGGYATLLCYTRLPDNIKSFSAWVPIADLSQWYLESKGRNQKYTDDVLKITSSQNNQLDILEAKKRSPLYDSIPLKRLKNSQLFIYTGIHDGYTGSVPITHSLMMYNHVVSQDIEYQKEDLISEMDMINLLKNRTSYSNSWLGDRKLHYSRSFKNIHVKVFEGGHEQLYPIALSLIPIQDYPIFPNANILTIGDSNATFNYGWSERLKIRNPYGRLYNYAIAGNTISFDNNDIEQLNTLKNLDSLVNSAYEFNQSKPFDLIIIQLGTNDCKSCFKKNWNELKDNYLKLIHQIQKSNLYQSENTKIVVITPPPIEIEKVNEKYYGSEKCISQWGKSLQKLAHDENLIFVDSYSFLKHNTNFNTVDGVHLNEKSQDILAEFIVNTILQNVKY